MMTNRTTVPNYCANCGSTGACKKYRDRYSDGCVAHARPLTLTQATPRTSASMRSRTSPTSSAGRRFAGSQVGTLTAWTGRYAIRWGHDGCHDAH